LEGDKKIFDNVFKSLANGCHNESPYDIIDNQVQMLLDDDNINL
jgi:hypothetical protein